MQAPSDHLLRTMAAVPISSYVLDLGCGEGRHTEPLLRLGFPVHACDPHADRVDAARGRIEDLVSDGEADTCVRHAGLDEIDYPEGSFDWVIAYHAETFGPTNDDLAALLKAARRVLKPGGWVYITVPAEAAEVDEHERSSGDGAPSASSAANAAAADEETGDDTFSIMNLEARRIEADLATASEPEIVREAGGDYRIRAIYRRVEPDTPA